MTSSACLAEVWGWDDRTVAQKQDLTMLYAPYVMLGKFTSILLLLFVLFSLWLFHACGFMFSLSFSFVSFFMSRGFSPAISGG